MPLYDLPISAGDSIRFPSSGFQGTGWKLLANEIPYVKHGSRAWERHFKKMRTTYSRYSVHSISSGGELWIAPQISAEAKSRLQAQRVFQLLITALTILDGNTLAEVEENIAIPRDRNKLEDLEPMDLTGLRDVIARDNVVFGSQFAAALSKRKFRSYSAFKLKLSYKLASAHWMDLHPHYYPKSFGVSNSFCDHVWMASAITLAYSAIEELQLEPRSLGNRPVKTKSGWDEAARRDLDRRLDASGVDMAEPLGWTRRGSQTRVHMAQRAAGGAKQPWTKGIVRDRAVTVQDALLEASWLRSKCTTHRYQKATSSITMYDVANVQLLARRLLLESVGLWKSLLHQA